MYLIGSGEYTAENLKSFKSLLGCTSYFLMVMFKIA